MSALQPARSATEQKARIFCRAIDVGDLDAVADCLARGFPEPRDSFWRASLRRLGERASVDGLPKFGQCLVADGVIVGALLQIHSRRAGPDGARIFCNLSSWCVDEAYRAYGLTLNARATSRPDVTYFNVSPAPHTRPALEATRQKRYNRGALVFAPLLSARRAGASVVAFEPGSAAAGALPEAERALLAEHAAQGCRALVGLLGVQAYGFVLQARRVLGGRVPVNQVIYCRDLASLAAFGRALGRALGWHASPLCVVDADGPLPGLAGWFAPGAAPKYYRGPAAPRLGDLSHSELVYLRGADVPTPVERALPGGSA